MVTIEEEILKLLSDGEAIFKTANRHKHKLSGNGFYANKFSQLHAKAVVAFKQLNLRIQKLDDASATDAVEELKGHLDDFFDIKSSVGLRSDARKKGTFLIHSVVTPALTEAPNHIATDNLFPLELIKETRGYIEKIGEQACGAYDKGWYDASAVMVRRLLEILIIETFETHGLTSKIQNSDGTFFYLKDLVTTLLNEGTWVIGRTVKKALPNLKDIGNQSAHGRRYVARRTDLDAVKRDLRLTIEELVNLSKLHK